MISQNERNPTKEEGTNGTDNGTDCHTREQAFSPWAHLNGKGGASFVGVICDILLLLCQDWHTNIGSYWIGKKALVIWRESPSGCLLHACGVLKIWTF